MSRWRELKEGERSRLTEELLRELADGHPLYGRAARAIARRIDCDDVAFDVGGSGLCVVHLTWAGRGDARWPRFEFVDHLPEDE
jgi:hypothetical protein